MRVFVKNLDGYLCTIEIESSDDMENVKAKIVEKIGLRTPLARLMFAGQQLGGAAKVSDYHIQEGYTLQISHRGPMERPSQ